jgi:hypothetical protein
LADVRIRKRISDKLRNVLGINDIGRRLDDVAKRDLVRELESRAFVSSAAFIEERMANAIALDSSESVLDLALAKVSNNSEGLFCEFGVYQARTINYIARKIGSQVYGFDSFKGLPEDWRAGFPAGTFGLDSKGLPTCEPNVELIVGWFDETLPNFIVDHKNELAFLHIDCDLYSSTKTIFRYLGPQLRPGSLIVFDEYFNYPGWQQHEHRAFEEFIESTGHRFEYLCYNRFSEQVAVQIL